MGGGRNVPKSGATVNSGGKLEAGFDVTLSVTLALSFTLAASASADCASVAFSTSVARLACASVAVSTCAARFALASIVLFAEDADRAVSRATVSCCAVAFAADARAAAASSRWALAVSTGSTVDALPGASVDARSAAVAFGSVCVAGAGISGLFVEDTGGTAGVWPLWTEPETSAAGAPVRGVPGVIDPLDSFDSFDLFSLIPFLGARRCENGQSLIIRLWSGGGKPSNNCSHYRGKQSFHAQG